MSPAGSRKAETFFKSTQNTKKTTETKSKKRLPALGPESQKVIKMWKIDEKRNNHNTNEFYQKVLWKFVSQFPTTALVAQSIVGRAAGGGAVFDVLRVERGEALADGGGEGVEAAAVWARQRLVHRVRAFALQKGSPRKKGSNRHGTFIKFLNS